LGDLSENQKANLTALERCKLLATIEYKKTFADKNSLDFLPEKDN
jgi:hypothetical protein